MRLIDADVIYPWYVKAFSAEEIGEERAIQPDEVRFSMRDIKENLDNISTVKQETKTEWIPVSERLPEDDTEVLITYIYSGHEIVNVAWINNREWYYRNDIRLSDIKVIAWMPLPDPYKAESEE